MIPQKGQSFTKYIPKCHFDTLKLRKSGKLEGLAVTFPETEAIFNGIGVANVKVEDIIAINNLKQSWQFIFDTIDCDATRKDNVER